MRLSSVLTRLYGKSTAGVRRDVMLIRPFGKIEVDFVADNPGLKLFYRHQQLHLDFGFAKLFKVA